MRIVFIGAGNVAASLASEFYLVGFHVVQVYSRTMASAQSLADRVNASAVDNLELVVRDADLYVFAVPDLVLEKLIGELPSNNGIWVHTAGSMPIDIFKDKTKRYGVLYPFQTFTKGRNVVWKSIPLLIEVSDEGILHILEDIAHRVSDKVCVLSSENRKYVHLAGVFACNFTNHMYCISEYIMQKVGLPFDFVLPLVDETCAKVHCLSPDVAQTGPAVRNDQNVMDKHLNMIENDRIRNIYKHLSDDIFEFSKKNIKK